MGRRSVVLWLAAALAIATTDAGARGPARTSITVFAAAPAAPYGGVSYGAVPTPTGATVTERREIEVASDGVAQITGVATTIDPATVQLRDEGGVLALREQRFVTGATSPDDLLARYVGDSITVVTARGEITGVLRSLDAKALVLETGAGDERRLQILRRDGHVLDIRLPAGKVVDQPTLVWRLATKKAGKHLVELTYRADGLSWSADYLAVYDEVHNTIDFTAWATLRNDTGTTFRDADVTLVASSGGLPSVAVNPYTSYGATPLRQSAPPQRFALATPIRIATAETVQVELIPPRVGAKARTVVAFEAIPNAEQMAVNYQQFPAVDCTMLTQTAAGSGRADIAVELDVSGVQLPEGRVRAFKRSGKGAARVDALGDEVLRAAAGRVRVRIGSHGELTGERKTACTIDERTRTMTEKVEIKLENKGKQPVDTVVREVMWRYPVWRIDPSGESTKGTRAGAQVQEYRALVAAGGKRSVTYTVVYQWP